ncbi:aminotransferase class I/II-fold pyridoxal phosphate-dependent enzyme [Candidatus Woesearchaeota archaeon]|nr:aminotransferase class I/II-fold pyridoxal phosphate-dependent enzyme [Candidatus Woesearchaeota archaeon]
MNLSSTDASRLLAQIKQDLQKRTKHQLITLTTRGDAAIKAALSLLPKDKTLLIPEEGGWLSYLKIPREKKIPVLTVKCDAAKIDLSDLQEKLKSNPCSALLYQNPGGYFAEQSMREISALCKEYHCLVIIDVSGAIGTVLCAGDFADILVCSFGKWKLVEAGKGGFISCKDEKMYASLSLNDFDDTTVLALIRDGLQLLDQKIGFLLEKRKSIRRDLQDYQIIHPQDLGFVIVIAFSTSEEKEKIINYCHQNELEWTECPRYIRVQRPAISIELKRLHKS